MPRLTNKPLTQRIIDTTPLPKKGMITLRDATVRGLSVRIFPGGSRTWSLEYRSPVTGKNARISFEAPALADARAIGQRHRATLSEGKDPNQERKDAVQARRIEHARSVSVADALDDYETAFLKHPKSESRRERMAKLRRAVGTFKDRAVASLTKGELVKRLDEVQTESGPIARNRAHAEMRAWLGWLAEREHVGAVVIAGVKKLKETSRERVLADLELGAILAATADGAPFSDLVRVLMHTGMRRDEAANLQPRDLDFAERKITVRGEVAKNNHERVIPLPEAIASMLETRANGVSREGYIFGEGSGFAAPFSGWGKATDRLREAMPEGEHWTLHDLRRTVDTRLQDADVPQLVIDDLLGHISGARAGVRGVYNRSVTLARQAKAVNDWGAKLAKLSNVVPLTRRVA